MPNPDEITDPTNAINMALVLMAKAFKLNYFTPTNNNQIISSNPCNWHIAQAGMNIGQARHMLMNAVQNPGIQNVRIQNGLIVILKIVNQNANQNGNGHFVAVWAVGNDNGNNGNQIRCYNYRGVGHYARNFTVRPKRRDATYLQTRLLFAQKKEAWIQLQVKEFDLMDAATEIKEIKEVNVNCVLMANLQQASLLSTQVDNAPVYDSDGSSEYTDLHEYTSEPHLVQHDDSNVVHANPNMEHSGEIVEQHPVTVEETRAYFESLYNNLAMEVEKFNTVNHKMKEKNDDLTTELARYKGNKKYIEINQEKYDKLERCYQKSVYQEQCLTKKINALHLCFAKAIMTLNEEITNLNNQLSKEKSAISYVQEERKKLKTDFKAREDEFLDKLFQAKKKIEELDYILFKTGVESTAETKRPQPRSNPKNDRNPSASKSSRLSNNLETVEQHHRNLLFSYYKKMKLRKHS
uniref:Uncharacterized protein n=1 Tax=Tanacetum cinerariifolium TaxID=118510 RepID=A0A6L2LKA2_TANCI|nr:hypothetical protein [Tanacetum cinerariifolium]